MEYRNHGNHNTYEVRNLSSNFITNQGNEVISNGKVHHSLTGYLFYSENPKLAWKQISRIFIPLRFTKAGRVWCSGARETHLATRLNGLTPSETKEFLKSPRFLKS